MATTEELVLEAKKRLHEKVLTWKNTPEAKNFLDATDTNQLSFTWEAFYEDGTVIRQYDDVIFLRALEDDTYIPPQDQIVSTDRIDKTRAKELILYPIAFTRKNAPWYQNHYRILARPEKGERIISKWLTDYIPQTGLRLRRHVLGIALVNEKEEIQSQLLFVLSPSGAMTLTGTEDVSYEGE